MKANSRRWPEPVAPGIHRHHDRACPSSVNYADLRRSHVDPVPTSAPTSFGNRRPLASPSAPRPSLPECRAIPLREGNLAPQGGSAPRGRGAG